MIDLILDVMATRWKPFSIVFTFFLIGFVDAKARMACQARILSPRSAGFVIALNVLLLVYLGWLCVRTSFYIQPRAKAAAWALAAGLLGAALAHLG